MRIVWAQMICLRGGLIMVKSKEGRGVEELAEDVLGIGEKSLCKGHEGRIG